MTSSVDDGFFKTDKMKVSELLKASLEMLDVFFLSFLMLALSWKALTKCFRLLMLINVTTKDKG